MRYQLLSFSPIAHSLFFTIRYSGSNNLITT